VSYVGQEIRAHGFGWNPASSSKAGMVQGEDASELLPDEQITVNTKVLTNPELFHPFYLHIPS